MPVSLSEAMLCECIPVGSDVNGIPDAIGPYGIVIHKRTANNLQAAIRKALTLESGEASRAHTIANFSIAVREKKMMDILRNYIS
jgi:glycosyltransferase involved in cell wall biosynthesis